jgi:novobiocin biosynthesis protein NovU/D-mycarose 3-C-methyltransferase
MIQGVEVFPLKRIQDERGTVMHMLKQTDPHFQQFGEIYFSVIHPGVIKAWHLHSRMTINYAVVVGNIKLALFDQRPGSPTKGELQEICFGQVNYQLVRVPPGVVNGFKSPASTPSRPRFRTTGKSSMANRTQCRICAQPLPAPFLDLGEMPLANSFLSTAADASAELRYPLAVAGCTQCGLVQLTHVVPAEQLYRDYIYVSSTSDGVRRHGEYLADTLIAQYGWQPADLIVEVASNDGTVLRSFKQRGVRVLGVEPARNIAAIAVNNGVPTLAEFFNRESAATVLSQQGRASLIFGRHVFAHVDDVHEFMDAVQSCLEDDGVFVVEVPYLGDFLEHLEFDTVYHEHLSYISLGAMEHLCREHGMELVDVERISLHGGSIVLHMRRKGVGAPSGRLTLLLEQEREAKMHDPSRLRAFAADVHQWKRQFEALIESLRHKGARMIGYGAAAKANTLLNFCPSAAHALPAILDRSPHKHGKLTPGTHIPVRPVEDWEQLRPTHLVILAWNFQREIMQQMQPFHDLGGSFVVPIPTPRVIAEAPPAVSRRSSTPVN